MQALAASTMLMVAAGGASAADRVELQGNVDGVQLDPLKPGTAPADSTPPRPPARGSNR